MTIIERLSAQQVSRFHVTCFIRKVPLASTKICIKPKVFTVRKESLTVGADPAEAIQYSHVSAMWKFGHILLSYVCFATSERKLWPPIETTKRKPVHRRRVFVCDKTVTTCRTTQPNGDEFVLHGMVVTDDVVTQHRNRKNHYRKLCCIDHFFWTRMTGFIKLPINIQSPWRRDAL
jgi:hypothetical protein